MVGCSPDGEVMLWADMANELMHGSSSFPDSQRAQPQPCAIPWPDASAGPGRLQPAAGLIPASLWEISSCCRVEGQADGSHGSFQPIFIIVLCCP